MRCQVVTSCYFVGRCRLLHTHKQERCRKKEKSKDGDTAYVGSYVL